MLTQGRFLISYQIFDNILKSYIIARYYGWEPKEEDLEEIISHTSFFRYQRR